MVHSMTGYGYSTAKFDDKEIIVEIKSLNSRYFDLRLTAPNEYKAREIDFRNILSESLNRGKISLTISVENPDDTQHMILNIPLIKHYHKHLSLLKNELNIPGGDILHTILSLPGILKESTSVLSEKEWKDCSTIVEKAIKNLISYRASEGQALADDMKSRIVNMLTSLDKIEKYEQIRLVTLREKIHQHLENFVKSEDIDHNRFEQELIYYVEKLDITEEKVRLRQHCSYFLDVLMSSDEVKGRKLDFITQEMGREINTLGAKANYSEIQHLAVNLKDDLEKIKEQIANVV